MAIKIPIDADIKGVQKKIEELAKTVEKASRVKWQPIDSAKVNSEAQKVQDAFKRIYGMSVDEAKARGGSMQPSGGRGHGGGGRGSAGIWGGGRDRFGRTEFGVSELGQRFASGVGGGFQTIGSGAARGAALDAASGGSGMGGLLRGGLWGAAAFGALKLGQGVSEGVDMAKDRALGLDVLKRQMGDIGVSFEKLKEVSETMGEKFGVSSAEFVKLESNLQKLSRTTENAASLGEKTQFGLGVDRAYGLSAGTTGNFIGGMQNIDQRQNYKELSVILADTIARTGMSGKADEVMQAILNFSSATTRMSLTPSNNAAFANSYTSLLNTHYAGMTPDNASAILQQTNSGFQNMGVGEAGRAAMLAAFNYKSKTTLNPIEGAWLGQGGAFGTRESVFGAGTPAAAVLGDRAKQLASGPGAKTTNLQSYMTWLNAQGMNSEFRTDALASQFQMSYGQAAALQGMDLGQQGKLGSLLNSNHIDINKVNPSGIGRLGRIAAAGTNQSQLSAIFEEMKNDKTLSKSEADNISSAKTPGDFQNALATAAATKDQTTDTGTAIRNLGAIMDDIKTNTGDKLLTPVIAMSESIVSKFGRGEHQQSSQELNVNRSYDEQEKAVHQAALKMRNKALSLPWGFQYEAVDKINATEDNLIKIDEAHRKQALAGVASPMRTQDELNQNFHFTFNLPDGTKKASVTNYGKPSAAGSGTAALTAH